MTATSIPPHITNTELRRWVEEMVELCKPDQVHWCDGSQEEYDLLCNQMVEGGTFIRLNQEKRPNCFLARSHPSDVARVEDRTYICCAEQRRGRPNQQLDGPKRNEGDPDASLRRRHARAHAVCDPLQHGTHRLAHLPHRRATDRLTLRGREYAHHDPHGRQGAGDSGRRRVRPLPPLGRHAAGAWPA